MANESSDSLSKGFRSSSGVDKSRALLGQCWVVVGNIFYPERPDLLTQVLLAVFKF